MMRKRIKVDGKFYKPVRWLYDPTKDDDADGCAGCAFTRPPGRCLSTEANGYFCEDGSEFDGYIFIPCTPEATVKYVTQRLDAS